MSQYSKARSGKVGPAPGSFRCLDSIFGSGQAVTLGCQPLASNFCGLSLWEATIANLMSILNESRGDPSLSTSAARTCEKRPWQISRARSTRAVADRRSARGRDGSAPERPGSRDLGRSPLCGPGAAIATLRSVLLDHLTCV